MAVMTENANILPQGWEETSLGVLGEYINGFAFKPQDWGSTGKPIIRIQNLTDPDKEYNYTTRTIDPRYIVRKNDILVSWSATLDAFIWHGTEALLNQHIFKVVPHSLLDKNFVFYLLKHNIYELIKSEHLHGTTMKHINRKPFLNHAVMLPPVNEQKRISDKIEELFSDLDKGEENLRQAQRLLSSYRQSVLKAAVTGELTRDWREANKHRLESGEELLKRILKTRREQWLRRGKYEEPTAPDTTKLPKLPKEWIWCRMEQLADVMGGLTKNAKRQEFSLKRPMLRVANVYQNRLELDDIHEIGVGESELKRVLLEYSDILIVEGNGSKDQIGRMAIWEEQIPDCIHQNHLIKARLFDKRLAKYIMMWFMSYLGREFIEKVASSTSGLHTLSLSKIDELVIPLPSIEEAQEIVSRIENVFSQISALEKWCETELTRSATLRQSILKSAFSGQLVPQDAADEPASELLKRIAAERAAIPKKRPAKRGRTSKQEAA